jgi:hypothetical protein
MLGIDILKRMGDGATGGGGGAGPAGVVDINAEWIYGTEATYTLDDDGFAYRIGDGSGVSWIEPQVGMENYEVRASYLSGNTLPSGPLGSWVAIPQTWTVPDINRQVKLLIEIRVIATGSIVDSAEINLISQSISDV